MPSALSTTARNMQAGSASPFLRPPSRNRSNAPWGKSPRTRWKQPAPGAPTRAYTLPRKSSTLTPTPCAATSPGWQAATATCLQWIQAVPADFHARYSARERHYRYLIRHHAQPSALWARRCHWHKKALDAAAMHTAAQALIGEHDFSAFRAAECQAKSPWRYIRCINVRERGGWLAVDISGNAFLHHMVRNIVGTLLAVGDGRRSTAWPGEVLASRDRRAAGITAPAQGLYLNGITYPPAYALPAFPPAWIPDEFQ